MTITDILPELIALPLIGMSCTAALYFLVCRLIRWRSGAPERRSTCRGQQISRAAALLQRLPVFAVRLIGTQSRRGLRLELRFEIRPAGGSRERIL